LDPQGQPVRATGPAGHQVFHVVFTDKSQPTLRDLTGTVFVIAVGAQQPGQTGQPGQPGQTAQSQQSGSSGPGPFFASSSFAASVLGAEGGDASAGGTSPVGPTSA